MILKLSCDSQTVSHLGVGVGRVKEIPLLMTGLEVSEDLGEVLE